VVAQVGVIGLGVVLLGNALVEVVQELVVQVLLLAQVAQVGTVVEAMVQLVVIVLGVEQEVI
jgi:hypothetical protein